MDKQKPAPRPKVRAPVDCGGLILEDCIAGPTTARPAMGSESEGVEQGRLLGRVLLVGQQPGFVGGLELLQLDLQLVLRLGRGRRRGAVGSGMPTGALRSRRLTMRLTMRRRVALRRRIAGRVALRRRIAGRR